jgi:Domain of unknown function (DUF4386)
LRIPEEGSKVPNRWDRFAPLTGVVFVVLTAVGFAVSGKRLSVHATGAKVLAYYNAHHSSEMGSAALTSFGIIFLVFFAAALRTHLRPLTAGGALAALGFAGAVLLAVGEAGFAGFTWSLADAHKSLAPAAAQALNVLKDDFFWPFAIGLAIFGIGYGLAIVRSRALPIWLGWIAVAIGILGVTPIGFIAFLVLMGWTLVVSVLVFRRGAASTAAPQIPVR